MKVLVTGGAGFVGSQVVEHYAKKGSEVIIFDNVSREEILGKKVGNPLYNWNYLANNPRNVKLLKGDRNLTCPL
jgi:CDP-paratose 2-epimerase